MNETEDITVVPAKNRGRLIKPAANGDAASNESPINAVRQGVDLPKWKIEVCDIQIVGRTSLIVHCWSHKAIRQMLDDQMGIAKTGREKKDPFADFVGSLYPVPGEAFRFGVPAPAFKAAAVTASNDVQLKMTQMRRAFHVDTYTVPIEADPLTRPETECDAEYAEQLKPYHAIGISMRRDMVRLESGVADIRFRAWWPKWRCTLRVEYNPRAISMQQLVNLFAAAGYGSGVGEWRPSAPQCRSGEFGRFSVA
jgi:hypothetical protein